MFCSLYLYDWKPQSDTTYFTKLVDSWAILGSVSGGLLFFASVGYHDMLQYCVNKS